MVLCNFSNYYFLLNNEVEMNKKIMLLCAVFAAIIFAGCSPEKKVIKGIVKADLKILDEGLRKNAKLSTIKDGDGRTLNQMLAVYPNENVIKMINAYMYNNTMALIKAQSIEEAQIYFERGVFLGHINNNPAMPTVLHLAVEANNVGIIEFLVKNGADPNLKSPIVAPVLLSAIMKNNIPMCKELMKNGAEARFGNQGRIIVNFNWGDPSLDEIRRIENCIQLGLLDAESILRRYYVIKSTADAYEQKALSRFEMWKMLVKNGANPNTSPILRVNGRGFNVLVFQAYTYGDNKLSKLLGQEIGCRSEDMRKKSVELLTVMIENGLDVNKRYYGPGGFGVVEYTLLKWAMENEHPELVKLLKSKNAKLK